MLIVSRLRRPLVIALLLGLGFGALESGDLRAEEPALAQKTALRPFKPRMRKERRPEHRLYLLPAGRSAGEAPALLRAKVDRQILLIADVDGDGRFDEPGVDGWCLHGDTHLLPITDPIVFGARTLRIRAAPEEKLLHFALTPIEAPPRILTCLAKLNALRRQNGLPTISVDPELSASCLLHAQYCDRWGQSHDEDPAREGYTEAGAAAGRAASIGGSVERMPAIYAQFFHRFSLTEPDTVAFGLAQSKAHALVDGMRGKGDVPFTWPVAIPAHGSKGQPLAFDLMERPLAYPDGEAPGLPITLQFRGWRTFEDVTASLHAVKKTMVPVDVWVSWPGKPAHAQFPSNYRAICLIPHKHLERNTTYEAVVSYAGDDDRVEHRWRFTTVAR